MIEKLKVKKQRVLKTLKEKNKTPNITLSAGYYQRDGFDDYVSVGFKLPLPIRVREENEIKKSIKDITKSGYRLQSIKNKLKREYEATKKQLIWLKSAIKRVKEIIKTLKEQKKLYASYTTPESIVKTLKVENKLIKNKIAKKEYQLKLLLTQIKLDYFRSKI